MKREIKDSLFRNIFKEKEYLAELYYDISNHKISSEEIRLLDLKNYVMSTLRNDIAFIREDDSMIVLIEHQSSTNYNMDVRLLLYYARILEQYINEKYKNGLHTTSKIAIPNAEFYVLYNGQSFTGDKKKYKTKISVGGLEIDFNTKIIDINFDSLSKDIVSREDSLSSYSYLIKAYYKNKEELLKDRSEESIEYISQIAFEKGLEELKEKGLYLSLFDRKEFAVMSMQALTLEDSMNIKYEIGLSEGKDEGISIGIKREQLNVAKNMLKLNLDKNIIAEVTGLSMEAIKELEDTYRYFEVYSFFDIIAGRGHLLARLFLFCRYWDFWTEIP